MSNQKSEPEPIIFIDTFDDNMFEVVEALVDGGYFDALANLEIRGRAYKFMFIKDRTFQVSFYSHRVLNLGKIKSVKCIPSEISHFAGYNYLRIETTCGIIEIHEDDEYI